MGANLFALFNHHVNKFAPMLPKGVINSVVYTQGKRSVPIQREAQNSSPAG